MSSAQPEGATTPEATAQEPEPVKSDKKAVALELVKRHAGYAAAVGLVPVPFVNAAGVAGIGIKLVRDLAAVYDVPFKQDRVKSIVGALLSGALSTEIGAGAAGMVKGLPVVGGALGLVAIPALAGASTYAIGKVFIQHFESGGTLLDFSPEKAKEYFRQHFGKAKADTTAPATA